MRYMLMHDADENTEAGVPPSPEMLAELGAYMEEAAKAGVLLAGEGVGPRPPRQVRGAGPGARRGRGGLRRRARRRRRRPAGPHVHGLLPRAVARGPGGAHAAAAGRADDGRDRPGLPGARGDDRRADHPGQAHARRRRRGSSCRRRPSGPTAWPRCSRSSTSSSTRGTRRPPATPWCGASWRARRCGSGGSSRRWAWANAQSARPPSDGGLAAEPVLARQIADGWAWANAQSARRLMPRCARAARTGRTARGRRSCGGRRSARRPPRSPGWPTAPTRPRPPCGSWRSRRCR